MNELKDAIKTTLPENSLVIFQCEDDSLQSVASSLEAMARTFARYGISPIACPKSIVITILPSGTLPSQVHMARREDH